MSMHMWLTASVLLVILLAVLYWLIHIRKEDTMSTVDSSTVWIDRVRAWEKKVLAHDEEYQSMLLANELRREEAKAYVATLRANRQ